MHISKLVYSYLKERKQRTKIGTSFNSWKDLLFGVPQVSILEPLLLNIFLSDLFLLTKDVDITSYPDDNTPYIVGDNMDYVITALQNAAASLFKCFSENQSES